MNNRLDLGEGEMTIIGDSVTIRGNLSGEEDLQVLGRVEGSIDLDSTLVVAESGIVKAEVTVKNAIISGVVVGNVHASESIELTQEGRMVGDISSPRVIIVDGASFRGNVDMGDIENMPERTPERAPPVSRPSSRPASSSRPAPARPAPLSRPAPARPAPLSRPAPEPIKEPEPEPSLDETEVMKVPTPSETVEAEAPKTEKKKPNFLNPPKAKGLPKKNKKKQRVVVKRK